ncbi:uncharacterized protein LOC126837976 [Adelges cooleyi]|uniref:uncharacterized protein LOC126837976 n=1 Tax=Adelges cooleyi TaxID=133065 RepID=UPI0021808F2A|nr:uncharacterized protein LOC126837976 [Adelges cooleyi]
MNPDEPEALSSADAEVIKDSFNDCLKWIADQGYENNDIRMGHCTMYASQTTDDFKITNDYLIENANVKFEPASLEQYTKILKYHCDKKGISAQECAHDWNEDRTIEDSFNDCMKWINAISDDCLFNSITTHQFCLYMGGTPNDFNIVYKYIADHFVKQSMENLYWIDIQAFSVLFKNHCNNYDIYVKEYAIQRKDATAIRIKEEIQKEDAFGEWLGRELN